MIGYVTLGTNDLAQAAGFYDQLLDCIGISRLFEEEGHFVAYGADMQSPGIAVTTPYNREKATYGNGTMVALTASDRNVVDAGHARALQLGGMDEGAPGLREDSVPGFYAAYFRDLDGNKLCLFCIEPPAA